MPKFNSDQCPNCGEDLFITSLNQYDVMQFIGEEFQFKRTECADWYEKLSCNGCSKEVDEEKSIKQGKVVLKTRRKK